MVHYLPVKYVLLAHLRYALYCSVALCTHYVLYCRRVSLANDLSPGTGLIPFISGKGSSSQCITLGVKINVLHYKDQTKTLR